jgi:PadR family transcriptional regulator PadR
MAKIPPREENTTEWESIGKGFISRQFHLCPYLHPPSCTHLDGLHNNVVDNLGMGKPIDLVQGTLDLLILKTLLPDAMHGWAIAKRIQQLSGEVLQVQQGSLYPALHRLEQQGWIKAKWAESETGRQAKFYSLTLAGRKQLEAETANWNRLSAAINLIVTEA